MVNCAKSFLTNGLLPFPASNYEIRKLQDSITEQFIEYADNIALDEAHEKKHLYEQFRSVYAPDFDHLKINTFTIWLKKWSDYKKYRFNPHKDGGRDNRNGVDYITIVKEKKQENEKK
ncbi:MAG: hypothetical protein AB7P01_18175 [Bacteroidia bacterium]